MVDIYLPIHYVTREIHSSHFVYKEDNIMKNVTTDAKTTLEMFATTVDSLISTIDAGILSGNYTDAEDSVIRMLESNEAIRSFNRELQETQDMYKHLAATSF